MQFRLFRAVGAVGFVAWLAAAGALPGAELTPLTIQVEGTPRTALAYFPAKAPPAGSPLVFVFHGHGGSAASAVRGFDIHSRWPEAICVYPEGLPTPSRLDPEGKQSGWQRGPGEVDDRDVKLFDALLARLRKEHKIDERRIYAAGFSNGGFFTYTLWAVRGDVLAAVAPCACLAGDSLNLLKPKPCLHLAGKADRVVAARLQFQTIAGIRRLNKCGETGVAWNPGPRIAVTYYDSPSGTPFVSGIHSGGHILPQSTGAWIVRFFKAQVRP